MRFAYDLKFAILKNKKLYIYIYTYVHVCKIIRIQDYVYSFIYYIHTHIHIITRVRFTNFKHCVIRETFENAFVYEYNSDLPNVSSQTEFIFSRITYIV